MKKGDEASPSIILAGQAFLVKMLITLDSVVHSVQLFILMYFNIVLPLVCETVMRLHRASFWQVQLF